MRALVPGIVLAVAVVVVWPGPAPETLLPNANPGALRRPSSSPSVALADARRDARITSAATTHAGAGNGGEADAAGAGASAGEAVFAARSPNSQQLETATPRAANSTVSGAPPPPRFVPDEAVRALATQAQAIAASAESAEPQDPLPPLSRLYLAFFGRPPDFEGLSYYLDERDGGASLAAIAEEFAGSTEFDQRYGTVDNAAFVERVYRNVTGGPGEASQRALWAAALDSGAINRGQLMLAFSEGTEFRTITDNEVFVTAAYAQALHRAPDPAEFSSAVDLLDSGQSRRVVLDRLHAAARK